MTERKIPDWVKEAGMVTGSLALLYCATWWGFNRQIKEEVWKRQDGICGEEGCNRPILEYHHRVPERMIRNSFGVAGKNNAENAVGLCFDHHKHKWDPLAAKGIIYPGIPVSEADPSTYTKLGGHHKRRR